MGATLGFDLPVMLQNGVGWWVTELLVSTRDHSQTVATEQKENEILHHLGIIKIIIITTNFHKWLAL